MEEFDAIFLRTMYQDDGYSAERAAIKSFISALLISERAKVAKEVEGLKRDDGVPTDGKPLKDRIEIVKGSYLMGHNAALDKAAALIRTKQ